MPYPGYQAIGLSLDDMPDGPELDEDFDPDDFDDDPIDDFGEPLDDELADAGDQYDIEYDR